MKCIKTKRCPAQFVGNYLFQFRKRTIIMNGYRYYTVAGSVRDNPENSAHERGNHNRGDGVFKELGFAKTFDSRRHNTPGGVARAQMTT